MRAIKDDIKNAKVSVREATKEAKAGEKAVANAEKGVEKAQAQIDNGQNPDAVALAQKIVEDQTAEITEMQELLAQL